MSGKDHIVSVSSPDSSTALGASCSCGDWEEWFFSGATVRELIDAQTRHINQAVNG